MLNLPPACFLPNVLFAKIDIIFEEALAVVYIEWDILRIKAGIV